MLNLDDQHHHLDHERIQSVTEKNILRHSDSKSTLDTAIHIGYYNLQRPGAPCHGRWYLC